VATNSGGSNGRQVPSRPVLQYEGGTTIAKQRQITLDREFLLAWYVYLATHSLTASQLTFRVSEAVGIDISPILPFVAPPLCDPALASIWFNSAVTIMTTESFGRDCGAPVDLSGQAAGSWRIIFARISFVLLFFLLSPIYYLNRWDFRYYRTRNPFYTSKLVRLEIRFPLLYELATFVETFPAWDHVYEVPDFSGDVLQVGCGTGLLNKWMRNRQDVRFTNLDPNLNALKTGIRLKRYSDYVHASIDKRTPLPDASFDVILFSRSFHHVRHHKKAFAECGRLLREGGIIIIADPVILHERLHRGGSAGYMGNSSIDGVIWRFTLKAFVTHLEECLPPELSICSINCVRQPHLTNYNLFVPQADVVAVMVKGKHHYAK
jgi:SAM-dependent methyltransferase